MMSETQGRESETRGLESRQRVWDNKLLSQAAFEGIIFLDAEDGILSINEVALSLVAKGRSSLLVTEGKEGNSVLGKSLLEITHLRSLKELCSMARASGSPCEREIRLATQGPERVLLARATPVSPSIRADSQTQGQVILTLLNRTELLHLRTVRTDFVANASHELRTPLATIQAMAETLQDGAAGDPVASERFLASILSQTHRMRRLVEDLLILTRAESEERNPVRLSLPDILRESVESERGHAERRQVNLTLTLPSVPLRIKADRLELDQVFVNLVDNGIKYTPAGGTVSVNLFSEETPQGESEAVIQITDTGIGILSDDIPRIFERFWRADRARQFQKEEGIGQTGGTGLGLSIVKHIIEAHKGQILVQSELGRGTTLTVRFPLVS